jgi:hypothetical protein
VLNSERINAEWQLRFDWRKWAETIGKIKSLRILKFSAKENFRFKESRTPLK